MKTLNILYLVIALSILSSCNKQTEIKTIIDIHAHVMDVHVDSDFSKYKMDKYFPKVEIVGALHSAKSGNIDETRKRNDDIIELSKSEKKVLPIASVHPYDGENALKELRRVKELGVKIIKLHSQAQGFDVLDKRALNLFEEAGQLELIIIIDCYGVLEPGLIEKLLWVAAYKSNTQWVFAHMGGAEFMKFAPIMIVADTNNNKAWNNVYFDISATVNLYANSPLHDELVWTIRKVGTDRILFGTDYPAFNLTETIEAFNKLDLTKEERANILYLNAKRLLKMN